MVSPSRRILGKKGLTITSLVTTISSAELPTFVSKSDPMAEITQVVRLSGNLNDNLALPEESVLTFGFQ